MKELEELKWIPGYEDHYKISPCGEVWSFKFGKLNKMSTIPQVFDYDIVNLTKKGDKETFLIHQLVMMTYGPKRPWPYKDYVITHKDNNKKNNCVDNLAWIKKSKVDHRKSKPVMASGIDDGDVIRFRSVGDAARYFHTNQSNIRRVINSGMVYKGYKFQDIPKQ